MAAWCNLVAAILILATQVASDEISDECIDCLAKVEMGQSGHCNMDQGSHSCGVYQIKKPYWQDCGRLGNSWKECAADEGCARHCIKNYMGRYQHLCRRIGRPLNCIDYGQIHNGGPNGCHESRTVHYVDLMEAKCRDELLNDQAHANPY